MKTFRFKSFLLAILMMTFAMRAEAVSLLNNKFSFDLPEGFTEMTGEEIEKKYPRANPPLVAYGNADRSISIAVTYSVQTLTADTLDELKSQMTLLLPRMIPGLEWKANEIVAIKYKKWVHFEMISNAIDTDIHNHMFLTDLEGRMLGINLNATQSKFESARKEFEAVIASLRVTA